MPKPLPGTSSRRHADARSGGPRAATTQEAVAASATSADDSRGTGQAAPPATDIDGPVASFARHWLLLLVCTTLGLALGLVAAAALPRSHGAQARVAVVADTNSAYSIAGYPLAARELAADYARWVQNNASGGTWAPAGVTQVDASPVPDSTTILIETQGESPEAAVAGVDEVAQALVAEATQAQGVRDPQAAYQAFVDLMPQVAAARTKLELAQTAYDRAVGSGAGAATIRARRATLQEAQVELGTIELRSGAAGDRYRRLYADTSGVSSLRLISPATATGDGAASAFARLGVVGAGSGFLLGAAISVLRDRRRLAPSPRRRP